MGEVPDQRDFLNAAVRVETDLEPLELLAACKAIERDLGRTRRARGTGRAPIDVDLLLVGDAVLELGAAARCRIRRCAAAASCSCRCSSSSPACGSRMARRCRTA